MKDGAKRLSIRAMLSAPTATSAVLRMLGTSNMIMESIVLLPSIWCRRIALLAGVCQGQGGGLNVQNAEYE